MSNCKSCTFCVQTESIVCSTCGKGFCCEEHEGIHRLPSDGSCIPIDILVDDIKGRYVVASRDIDAGEVIFVDKPVVVGPNHEVSPICITCSQEVHKLNKLCSSCGYPLCDIEKCSVIHGSNKECTILSSTKDLRTEFIDGEINYQNWFAVLPMRLCLLKETNPKAYALIERLMDHSDKVILTDRWKDIDKNVLQILVPSFSQEEVIKASGILDVNAYEIHTNMRGLFPLSSLLSHGCLPNVEHIYSYKKPYEDICRATVSISKGQEIFALYINPFMSRFNRQKSLRTGWYFDCSCSRCVSEGKEFLDHVKCPSCYGFGTPKQNTTTTDQWKCTNCSEKFGGHELSDRIQYCDKELEEIIQLDRYHINRYLDVYKISKNILHPRHELHIKLYKWLMPIFCREETQGLYTLSDLELKKEMMDHLMATTNDIIPGLNRRRGKILYELVDVDYKLLNADCQRGSQQDLVAVSKKVRKFLRLCQEIECIFKIGELSNFEKGVQLVNDDKIKYFNDILKTL